MDTAKTGSVLFDAAKEVVGLADIKRATWTGSKNINEMHDGGVTQLGYQNVKGAPDLIRGLVQ